MSSNEDEKPFIKRSDSSDSWDSSFTITSSDSWSPPNSSGDATVSLHPTLDGDGLLVKVDTPRTPRGGIDGHVPCDIVLVVDVSESMGCNAPVPGGGSEDYGLSVLDLTKHAARTILETLDHGDRLGIVTFESNVKVVQSLIPMTTQNKALAERNINSMQPFGLTNLWHGILEGLKLFNGETGTGRVPAVFILTDGQPNYLCPPQGYVPKIRNMELLPATIHTFGFGYNLRSGLLKSIAEISGGNYAFIPDAGMIGTVFIHAVANLQSTYADRATLTLKYSKPLALKETTGVSVDKTEPEEVPDEPEGTMQLTISLGNLQYGQSRDIYLRITSAGETMSLSEDVKKPISLVEAVLSYSRMLSSVYRCTAQCLMSDTPLITEAEMAYHKSRSMICSLLASLLPLRGDGEHVFDFNLVEEKRHALAELIKSIPARRFVGDDWNQSLMDDLCGAEPKGQISLALNCRNYLNRWGIHYLPSLLNAYTQQICNSFKDSGPLRFGANSPLFISCRDKLDAAFDQLPAPTPSNHTSYEGPINMAVYNNSSGSCFSAQTPVALVGGRQLPISQLRRGMSVQTPAGPRHVVAVLCTSVQHEPMCRIGEWHVTPWHPVSVDGVKSYFFPASVASKTRCTAVQPVLWSGLIYSVLLQPDQDPAAHAIQLGGKDDTLWGVTLGHGLKEGEDVRAHQFFGDWAAVDANLRKLGVQTDGLVLGGGAERKEGRVCGFREFRGDLDVAVAGRPKRLLAALHATRLGIAFGVIEVKDM